MSPSYNKVLKKKTKIYKTKGYLFNDSIAELDLFELISFKY
jgi:hypothetical protein